MVCPWGIHPYTPPLFPPLFFFFEIVDGGYGGLWWLSYSCWLDKITVGYSWALRVQILGFQHCAPLLGWRYLYFRLFDQMHRYLFPRRHQSPHLLRAQDGLERTRRAIECRPCLDPVRETRPSSRHVLPAIWDPNGRAKAYALCYLSWKFDKKNQSKFINTAFLLANISIFYWNSVLTWREKESFKQKTFLKHTYLLK